jgi:hypothetical protein
MPAEPCGAPGTPPEFEDRRHISGTRFEALDMSILDPCSARLRPPLVCSASQKQSARPCAE